MPVRFFEIVGQDMQCESNRLRLLLQDFRLLYGFLPCLRLGEKGFSQHTALGSMFAESGGITAAKRWVGRTLQPGKWNTPA